MKNINFSTRSIDFFATNLGPQPLLLLHLHLISLNPASLTTARMVYTAVHIIMFSFQLQPYDEGLGLF